MAGSQVSGLISQMLHPEAVHLCQTARPRGSHQGGLGPEGQGQDLPPGVRAVPATSHLPQPSGLGMGVGCPKGIPPRLGPGRGGLAQGCGPHVAHIRAGVLAAGVARLGVLPLWVCSRILGWGWNLQEQGWWMCAGCCHKNRTQQKTRVCVGSRARTHAHAQTAQVTCTCKHKHTCTAHSVSHRCTQYARLHVCVHICTHRHALHAPAMATSRL